MLDRVTCALMVLTLLAASCGDSDSKPEDAGTDASLAIPDSGTDAGSPPPSTLPDATTPTGNAIMCGTNTCAVPGEAIVQMITPLLGGLLPPGLIESFLPMPCCAEDDACGVITQTDAGAAMCAPPPDPDPRCPNADLFGFPLIGCCDEAQGICGANLEQFGFGCVAVEVDPMNPPPSCGDADAGSEDAGEDDGGS